MQTTYKTIAQQSEGLYKEKGSKFIGIAVACYKEEDAKLFLDEWRKEHHQASHLCYAYRFGLDQNVFRANDDGEPNNSAGSPILGQIDSFELSNTLIGVVRYYGGTKLGVGGLINAYRTAAKEALLNAQIIELEVYRWVKLKFNYVDLPQMMNIVKKNKLNSTNLELNEACVLTLNLSIENGEEILNEIVTLSSCELFELGIY